MTTWPTVALGDLVSVRGGGTPRRTTSEFYGGGIPWVTPKDMKHPLISGSSVTLTEQGVASSPAKLIAAGAVLVVVRSGVLKHSLPVAGTTVPVTVNQDMKALLPSVRLDGTYLRHLLKARSSEILTWVRATTADNFPIQKLLGLEVRLPPIEEQRRIAAILDHAALLHGRLRERVDSLASLEASVFRARFAADDARATVADLALKIKTGPFGSQLLHSEFVSDGVAVLGLDNVVANEFRWAERRYITRAKYEQLRRYTVSAGDVLISIMGTVGRCVVVPDDIPLAINTKHICSVTPNPTLTLPAFLRAAFLWHPQSRAFLRQQTKGAIMDGLNMGVIKGMPIPRVSLSRQREFADDMAVVRRICEQANLELATGEALNRALQARAFSGRL